MKREGEGEKGGGGDVYVYIASVVHNDVSVMAVIV